LTCRRPVPFQGIATRSDAVDWLCQQWNDIKGNVKYAAVLGVGWAVVTGVVGLTHGLLLWQQVVLAGCFVFLFGWALIATMATRRLQPAPEIASVPYNVLSRAATTLLSNTEEPGRTAELNRQLVDTRLQLADVKNELSRRNTVPVALGPGSLDLAFKGMSSINRVERHGDCHHLITVTNSDDRAAENVEVVLAAIGDEVVLPGYYSDPVIAPFTLNPSGDKQVEFAKSWDAAGRLMVTWNGVPDRSIELKAGQCWHIRIGVRSASHQFRSLVIFMKYEDGHVSTGTICGSQ
jgi:hypothetical protein